MTKRKDEKETKTKTHDPDASVGGVPPDGAGAPAEAAEAPGGEPAASEAVPEPTELDRVQDQLLRLQADFDNYRKRSLRERDEFQKRAGEAVLRDLIPVLDQLDFGLQQAADKPEWESYAEGLRLIRASLQEALRKHGLVEVEALGREFDPHEHDAIAHAPSPEAPDGTIVAQTRKGYRLGDHLLRAAMVVVSSGPGADAGEAGSAPEWEG